MDTVASVPEDGEKIIEIQLERLRTFRNHPFKVRMDQEMIRLREKLNEPSKNPKFIKTVWGVGYEIE